MVLVSPVIIICTFLTKVVSSFLARESLIRRKPLREATNKFFAFTFLGLYFEEDEDHVEHEHEEAKRQLHGGEGDQGPEHLHPAQAKQAVLAPGDVGGSGRIEFKIQDEACAK